MIALQVVLGSKSAKNIKYMFDLEYVKVSLIFGLL